MRILVTGFDPFDKDKVNPAYEAVKLLPDEISGSEIIKIEIPTVYSSSTMVTEKAIEQHKPDVVLCVGQAGGRSSITVEKVAINLAEARIPDNDGEQPMDQKLREDGETAYFATIPVKSIVKNIRDNGIPANISYTAGTFVCNSIMYNVLYLASKKYKNIKTGFIHVPFAMEQVADKPDGVPSMSVETIARAIEYAIEAIVEDEDIKGESMGTIM